MKCFASVTVPYPSSSSVLQTQFTLQNPMPSGVTRISGLFKEFLILGHVMDHCLKIMQLLFALHMKISFHLTPLFKENLSQNVVAQRLQHPS